jgi:hypothetical protein
VKKALPVNSSGRTPEERIGEGMGGAELRASVESHALLTTGILTVRMGRLTV